MYLHVIYLTLSISILILIKRKINWIEWIEIIKTPGINSIFHYTKLTEINQKIIQVMKMERPSSLPDKKYHGLFVLVVALIRIMIRSNNVASFL